MIVKKNEQFKLINYLMLKMGKNKTHRLNIKTDIIFLVDSLEKIIKVSIKNMESIH